MSAKQDKTPASVALAGGRDEGPSDAGPVDRVGEVVRTDSVVDETLPVVDHGRNGGHEVVSVDAHVGL